MKKITETLEQAKSIAIDRINTEKKSLRFKIVLLSLGVFFVFVFIFYLYLLTIDTSQYEKQIKDYVQDHYKATLDFDSVSWSVMPRPSLNINDAKIANSHGEILAKIDQLQLKLAFGQIFDGNIDISSLNLKKPELYFTSKGKNSPWADIYVQKQAIKESVMHDMIDMLKTLPLKEIPINSISIEDGTVYKKSPYYELTINNIDFELDSLYANHTTRFDSEGNLKLKLLATPDGQKVKKNTFFTAAAQSIKGFETPISFSGKVRLQDRIFQFAQVKIEANLDQLYDKKMPVIISIQGQYNLQLGELIVDPIEIKIEEAKVAYSVKVETTQMRQTEVVISIPQQKPHIGRLIKPFVTSTPSNDHIMELVQSLEIGGHLISTEKSLGFQLKTFNVDAHPGNIDLAIDKQTGQVTSAINLSYIDTRPILAPFEGPRHVSLSKKEIETIPELADVPDALGTLNKSTAPKLGELHLPQHYLQNLAMDLDLNIGEFIHPNYEIKAFKAFINADKGIITLKPMHFIAFDGQVDVQARLDANTTPMEFSLLQSSERINIGDLIERTTRFKWVVGLMDNKLEVNSSGDTLNEFIGQATGTLDLRMREGGIPGANLYQVAADNIDVLKGILPSSRRATIEKDPTLQMSGSKIDDFFATFNISKDDISAHNALMIINNRQSNTSIKYLRQKQTLEITAPVHLLSLDDLVNSLEWPVVCRSKDWSLPRCGVNAQVVRDQAKALLTGQQPTSVQQEFNENLEGIQDRK